MNSILSFGLPMIAVRHVLIHEAGRRPLQMVLFINCCESAPQRNPTHPRDFDDLLCRSAPRHRADTQSKFNTPSQAAGLETSPADDPFRYIERNFTQRNQHEVAFMRVTVRYRQC